MKVGLAHQIMPPLERFEEAVALGEKIIAAVDQRFEIIAELGIDPKFGLPQANWHESSKNDFRDGYNLLATLAWDQIKYLRFRSQCFTGFSLLHMKQDFGSCSEPIPSDYDDSLPEECPAYLIKLWQPRVNGFAFGPKAMLGEVGWWVGGVILNADTVAYQERMFLLSKSTSLPKRVLEIGGGYGALAYAITLHPNVEYWIVDLPESLLFSGLYLTMASNLDVKLWPERGQITLVPNYLFGQITDKFDLFINTLSLAEMTEHQARVYVQGISKLMAPGANFFEQNHANNDLPDGTPQKRVKDICAEVFSNRVTLSAPFEILNGPADVWSN